MREEKEISPDLQRPLVIRALRRSSVRKKIIQYLYDIRPNGSYAAEIAYQVHTTPSNVAGAINGMPSRYRNAESLIRLRLVEQLTVSDHMKIYRLTDFGKEIMDTIND
jgi:hypothetical protein